MLILTRKENEWIEITVPCGDRIRTIRIGVQRVQKETECHTAKVSLAIEADRDIVIMRDNAKVRSKP